MHTETYFLCCKNKPSDRRNGCWMEWYSSHFFQLCGQKGFCVVFFTAIMGFQWFYCKYPHIRCTLPHTQFWVRKIGARFDSKYPEELPLKTHPNTKGASYGWVISVIHPMTERETVTVGTHSRAVASAPLSSPSIRYTLPYITYSKLSARDGAEIRSERITPRYAQSKYILLRNVQSKIFCWDAQNCWGTFRVKCWATLRTKHVEGRSKQHALRPKYAGVRWERNTPRYAGRNCENSLQRHPFPLLQCHTWGSFLWETACEENATS